MDDQLDEFERADVNGRILQMIAEQPTVEEQQETLQEGEQAVYQFQRPSISNGKKESEIDDEVLGPLFGTHGQYQAPSDSHYHFLENRFM